MGYASNADTTYNLTGLLSYLYNWNVNDKVTTFYSTEWNIAHDITNSTMGSYLQNSGTYAAKCFMGSFFVPQTTNYTIDILIQTGNDCGKLSVELNGTQKWLFDAYTAGRVYNSYNSYDIGSLSQGQYNLQIRTSGKNASSSNYYNMLQSIGIRRTP